MRQLLTSVLCTLGLFAAPAAAQTLSSPPPQLSPALADGAHQIVVNDVRLWYRAAGEDGTPVVFLHGGPGQGSQTFARFLGPELETRLKMIYLDQRGSGRSERPWTQAYSLELLVDDLEQLRRNWGVEQISLVGHSFGSILALEYAAAYPEHTRRVALLAAAPDLRAAMDLQCQRLQAKEPATYARAVEGRDPRSGARCNPFVADRAFIDEAMFPQPDIQRLVETTDSEDGLRNTGELGQALFGDGALANYRFVRFERLTMPVLVFAGLADFQTGVEPQRELVRSLPRARLVELPDRGHFMFVEDPDTIAAELIDFLAR